ncbi:MAG: polymer-forming cytoskeletal protein [Kiritimatiellae bacterium]|nr:polymer-forming cytoskeletal protein [Kiritimatiellia bacterium]
MSALRKSTEVDGLSLVRATRHARTGTSDAAPVKSGPPNKPPKSEGEKGPAARIGHTAMPTKNEVLCYECGYEFKVTGRTQTLRCPKCRCTLDQTEYTIDSEWTEPIRTVATIRITSEGVLKSGTLVAKDVIIAGKVEGGSVKANRRLEILPGAKFDQDLLSGQDLKVALGAKCVFRGKRVFRQIEVAGELKGHFETTGLITVKPGGHLKGRIQSAHLVVEEGGGLTAELEIEPHSK